MRNHQINWHWIKQDAVAVENAVQIDQIHVIIVVEMDAAEQNALAILECFSRCFFPLEV